MPDNQFKARCPKCYSDEHSAYHLRIPFLTTIIDAGTPYGESMRHCHACGLKFSATSAVELREVPMVEPLAWLGMEL